MDAVRVIAAMGVTLRGPAKVKLSPAQHALRSHVLGAVRKDGVYNLDGAITFKAGEEFGLDQAEGRLNKADFEVTDGQKAKAAAKKVDAADAGKEAAEVARKLAESAAAKDDGA